MSNPPSSPADRGSALMSFNFCIETECTALVGIIKPTYGMKTPVRPVDALNTSEHRIEFWRWQV